MNIKIADLKPQLIKGVDVQMPSDIAEYKETYFKWTASSIFGKFKTNEISGGLLQSWHHTPFFNCIETHDDAEIFYIVSGTALMLFIDCIEGKPDTSTAQIVRIKPGMQIVIEAGKGHFVPVSEGSDVVTIIVISPAMDAVRISLNESIIGV